MEIFHGYISDMPVITHDHELLSDGDRILKASLRILMVVGCVGRLALDLIKYDNESITKESVQKIQPCVDDSGNKIC
jgi:hypothetical protein